MDLLNRALARLCHSGLQYGALGVTCICFKERNTVNTLGERVPSLAVAGAVSPANSLSLIVELGKLTAKLRDEAVKRFFVFVWRGVVEAGAIQCVTPTFE